MERKIGEIFEFDGEWYQCAESEQDACTNCAFNPINGIGYNCSGSCAYKQVIFKKLEKVGEPYYNYEKKLCQQYKCYINPLVTDEIVYVFADNKVVIEIKQNKEDMEEKKVNLKPFSLELAKQGKPVCTRDGRKARIICWDRKLFYRKVSYPILALVERSDGEDDVCGYNEKGKVLIEDGAEYKDDLMMLPEKKEGWVNLYKSLAYSTKEGAMKYRKGNDYIDTIKISWEE